MFVFIVNHKIEDLDSEIAHNSISKLSTDLVVDCAVV